MRPRFLLDGIDAQPHGSADSTGVLASRSMQTPAATVVDVESPCVKICRIGTHGHCTGCGRDLDEIMAWPRASRALKLAIRERAAMRLQDHPNDTEDYA